MTRIRAIRDLLGRPWFLGSADPATGLDCLTCAALVYKLIGEARGEAERWRFPLPGTWRELLEYHRLWSPAEPGFGSVVVIRGGHVGVEIEDGDVIHCGPRVGVVITPARRLQPFVTGRFVPATEPAKPDPVLRAAGFLFDYLPDASSPWAAAAEALRG
jgi:cell wall-associated NlpC family hydrolase